MAKNVVETISRLLAIAEDDNATKAERESAAARAQILSTRHSIDLDMARKHSQDKEKVQVPIVRQVEVGRKGDRGSGAYSTLLASICRPNGIRVVYNGDSHVTMYGFEDSIDMAELLYGVLAPQMVSECREYIKTGEWKTKAKSIGDARRSFYAGFCAHIEERLDAARQEAEDDAEEEYQAQGQSTALVLRTRKEKVEELYVDENDNLPDRQWDSGSSRSARLKGRKKAANARIGNEKEIAS